MGQLASLFGGSDSKVIETYFEDKVVWVTGASAGFGEALCIAICQMARPRGLILSARSEANLERVKRFCLEVQPSLEGRLEVLPLDLSIVDDLPAKAEAAIAKFGRVDVMVNNGGVGFRGLGMETPLSADRQVMEVDYFSGVALVKALLPGWLAASSGHVVQISSVQGFFGLPGRTAYAAAKHAAIGFYDSLRAEVADNGISVTVIGPGYIATGHSANAVHGSAGKYPEGHTSKGVPPEILAPQVLAAVARRRAEFVPAAFDARLARMLRTLCPSLLFCLMRKRARKEKHERQALTEKSGRTKAA